MRERLLLGIGSNGRFSYIAEDPAYITYTLYYNIEINLQQCAQYIALQASLSLLLFFTTALRMLWYWCVKLLLKYQFPYYYYFVLFCWWCNGLYFVSRVFHIVNNNLNLRLWRENSTKIKETFKKKNKTKNKELLCHIITWCT